SPADWLRKVLTDLCIKFFFLLSNLHFSFFSKERKGQAPSWRVGPLRHPGITYIKNSQAKNI
ncbi:MAG: hypothetical protein J7J87_02390, partial [Candidatus Diapherotrites archaeon]|nr:hypothetical protein [Candidatus Diapherotrites archaeon]